MIRYLFLLVAHESACGCRFLNERACMQIRSVSKQSAIMIQEGPPHKSDAGTNWLRTHANHHRDSQTDANWDEFSAICDQLLFGKKDCVCVNCNSLRAVVASGPGWLVTCNNRPNYPNCWSSNKFACVRSKSLSNLQSMLVWLILCNLQGDSCKTCLCNSVQIVSHPFVLGRWPSANQSMISLFQVFDYCFKITNKVQLFGLQF